MSQTAPDQIASLRVAVDRVDDRIIDALAERAGLVAAIWRAKAACGTGRHDPRREAEMRARLASAAHDRGLDAAAVARIFDAIIGAGLAAADAGEPDRLGFDSAAIGPPNGQGTGESGETGGCT